MYGYKDRLQAILGATITEKAIKDPDLVSDMLYDAILQLNYEAIERQRQEHKQSGVTVTPNATLIQLERELAR